MFTRLWAVQVWWDADRNVQQAVQGGWCTAVLPRHAACAGAGAALAVWRHGRQHGGDGGSRLE